jgi:hypothetical protein
MNLYRKKPLEIEAMQYLPPSTLDTVAAWVDAMVEFEDWFVGSGGVGKIVGQNLHIKRPEDEPNDDAVHIAVPGDWIIRGVQGEFYPCKPDIFAATYDPEGVE